MLSIGSIVEILPCKNGDIDDLTYACGTITEFCADGSVGVELIDGRGEFFIFIRRVRACR